MSHKRVNSSEDDYAVSIHGLDNSIEEANEEMFEITNIKKPADDSYGELEVRVEKLKNDVKNLKKIKKQQEKLGKLEEKKLSILKEIETEQEREKRSKNRHDKRKR